MKRLHTYLIIVLMSLMLCSDVLAQAPQGIPYQGVARNSSGDLICNKKITIVFTIRDKTSNGKEVFKEKHYLTTNHLGLFTCNIGQGNDIIGELDDVDWGNGGKFLQVSG